MVVVLALAVRNDFSTEVNGAIVATSVAGGPILSFYKLVFTEVAEETGSTSVAGGPILSFYKLVFTEVTKETGSTSVINGKNRASSQIKLRKYRPKQSILP